MDHTVVLASTATPVRPFVPPIESAESGHNHSSHSDANADPASDQHQDDAVVDDDFQMHEEDLSQIVEDEELGDAELIDDEAEDADNPMAKQSLLPSSSQHDHDHDRDILMGDLSDISNLSDDDSVPDTTQVIISKEETPASETKRNKLKSTTAIKGIGSTARWPIDEVEMERMKASVLNSRSKRAVIGLIMRLTSSSGTASRTEFIVEKTCQGNMVGHHRNFILIVVSEI
jgi:hypothetical protein